MQEQQPGSLTTILYRLAIIEDDFKQYKQQLQDQLKAYDTSREGDLKLQVLNDTGLRIESGLRDVRAGMDEMSRSIITKEGESKQRDSAIWTAQDKLQIKVLLFILTTVVSLVGSLLIYYITSHH